MAKRKKLYFDVQITGQPAASGLFKNFLCALTPGFAAGTNKQVAGDRYGGFLDTLPALTGGSAPEVKRRNSVSAWFQCGTQQNFSLGEMDVDVCLWFVGADGVTKVPYMKPGGGVNATFAGMDAVYTSAVAARLAFKHTALFSAGDSHWGTLYVQRQHSIEV